MKKCGLADEEMTGKIFWPCSHTGRFVTIIATGSRSLNQNMLLPAWYLDFSFIRSGEAMLPQIGPRVQVHFAREM